ncbi:MAG: hypothetical protein NUV53_02385 [Patescibacteria group bacterium]|nr:hypothetical protein [Patescibacteria group bacterium]
MSTKKVGFSSVYRVATFVSPEHASRLIEGVIKVSALRHGNYDSVAWSSAPGVEQFRPLEGSTPTSGEIRKLASFQSVKVEFSIPGDAKLLERVINEGIVPNHPWEEPVIIVIAAQEVKVRTIKAK